jgi:hypothetical protein
MCLRHHAPLELELRARAIMTGFAIVRVHVTFEFTISTSFIIILHHETILTRIDYHLPTDSTCVNAQMCGFRCEFETEKQNLHDVDERQ